MAKKAQVSVEDIVTATIADMNTLTQGRPIQQIGMNDPTKGRRQYVILVDDKTTRELAVGHLFDYGNNASHRWIPLHLFKLTGVLHITLKQARWLVDRFTLVHKLQGVMLKDITPEN